jgi:hypothetical protein
MAASTPPGSLAEALAALQAAMPRVAKEHTANVQTKTGGNYKYAYADLTDCSAALYPVMAPLGLSFIAKPTVKDGKFVLEYSLLHSSGQDEGGHYPLPDPDRLGPQDLGKAITYARRYALCAVTGLAPGGDDDDAQSAQQAARQPRTAAAAKTAETRPATRRAGAAHERLVHDDMGHDPAKVTRTRPAAPDPEDPWAQEAPVSGPRAQELRETIYQRPDGTEIGTSLTDPEDKPGSANTGQLRAVERMLTFVGTDPKERDSRHEMTSVLLGIDPPIQSMTDLSYAQAADLIKLLNDEAAKIRERARA